MARNNRYFYLSGLLSFTLFFIVIILFFMLLLSTDKLHKYALQKQKYIAVSITLTQNIPTQQNAKPHPIPEPKPLTKIEPEKISEPVQKIPDISSLFSSVSTKKITYKKKPKPKKHVINERRIAQMQKRIKMVDKKHSEDAKKRLKTLKLTKPSVKEVGAKRSGGAEVNQYFAKIQALVYQDFYPPVNSEGTSAKVRIWIDANGRLSDYRVLAYSANSLFNSEVDQLKARLKSVFFPKHPQDKPSVLDIILVSQE